MISIPLATPLVTQLLWAALAASDGPTSSRCVGCVASHGVHVELEDGGSLEGYVPWNEHFYRLLLARSHRTLNPAQLALLAERGYRAAARRSPDVLFARWLELVERTREGESPEGERAVAAALARAARDAEFVVGDFVPSHLRIYLDLHRVRFPAARYVPADTDVLDLPWEEIRCLAPAPGLSLRVDLTGSEPLAREDIARLARRPSYWVRHQTTVGATDYLVYGHRLPLGDLLASIEFSADSGEQLLVNGRPLAGPTAGKARSLSDEDLRRLGVVVTGRGWD